MISQSYMILIMNLILILIGLWLFLWNVKIGREKIYKITLLFLAASAVLFFANFLKASQHAATIFFLLLVLGFVIDFFYDKMPKKKLVVPDSVRFFVVLMGLFFFAWLAVFSSGVNILSIQSEDTVPTILTTTAIIQDGTLYLDKYYNMMISSYPHPDDKKQVRGLTPFYLSKVGEHYLSAFTLTPALLSVPIFLVPLKLGLPVNFENLAYLVHASSAFYVALSGWVLYQLVRKHFKADEKSAKLIATVYLFGTINFALLSQGLWQHGFVELFLLAGLLTFYDKKYFWSGIFFGLALLTRPTTAIAVGLLSILVLYQLRIKIIHLVKYVTGFIPPTLFFFWYNSTYYQGIQNQGYTGQVLNSWLSPFPQGFLGMWFSPSKGILVYSPILVFGLIGAYLIFRKRGWKKEENLKYLIFAAIILVHTVVLSLWKHWYGGWSFGYRMASDVIPFLVLLTIPYLQSPLYEKTKKWFWALLIFSILVQISGIIFFDGVWHAAYDNGFENTGWLWSVRDSEFIFNLRRILVKFGLLVKACPNC